MLYNHRIIGSVGGLRKISLAGDREVFIEEVSAAGWKVGRAYPLLDRDDQPYELTTGRQIYTAYVVRTKDALLLKAAYETLRQAREAIDCWQAVEGWEPKGV